MAWREIREERPRKTRGEMSRNEKMLEEAKKMLEEVVEILDYTSEKICEESNAESSYRSWKIDELK